MKKIIFQFVTIYTTIFLLFKYNIVIKNNIEYMFFDFIKNILPTMFPLLLITNYVKHNILNKTNIKLIRLLSLSLSFAPGNAILTNNKKELIFSSNINPLFSYVMLNKYLDKKTSLIIISINLIFNYILLFKNIKSRKEKINIPNQNIIKESMISLINIFGIIMFFNILISILSIFINNKLLIILEITNGYNIIKTISNYNLKVIFSIFLNSFCGISIYVQMNSMNKNINKKLVLSKIKYSLFIVCVTYIILLII